MTSFTYEELTRLVQLITGFSQLPPGGFAELSPPIQISSVPTADALPTAHTWLVSLPLCCTHIVVSFAQKPFKLK